MLSEDSGELDDESSSLTIEQLFQVSTKDLSAALESRNDLRIRRLYPQIEAWRRSGVP